MKKLIAMVMALTMAISMTGCSKPAEVKKTFTNDELATIINDVRKDTDWADMPVVTKDEDAMLFEMLGFSSKDLENYAMSISMVNIKAYGVAILKPVEGKEKTVADALDAYTANIQKSFEMYLQDQYEVAKGTVRTTLDNGYIVYVMAPDAQKTADAITAALTK